MSNDYFNHVDFRVEDGITARGADVNNPIDQVEQGFEKLPAEQALKRGLVNYAVATGIGNAYSVAMPSSATAYTDGMEVLFKANHANTGAATINVDTLGARSIKRQSGADITAGEIPLNKIVSARYNATSTFFEIQSGSPKLTADAEAAAIATAADAVQTGLDRIATGADADATAADRIATGADRVQTGLDAVATAADRVQTGLDAVATAADRVQTGLDKTAAEAAATAAAASEDVVESLTLSYYNFQGDWSSLVGVLNKPATVRHNSLYWILLNDLADVALSEPGVSADWGMTNRAEAVAFNDIINGQFKIAQIGETFVSATSHTYDLDGWLRVGGGSPSARPTISRVAGSVAGSYARQSEITTARELLEGDFEFMETRLLGYDCVKYIGKTFTIHAKVKSDVTGIHCISIYNLTQSYVHEVNILAANTWQTAVFTVVGGIPALNSSTNGEGFRIRFTQAAGTTYQTATTDAWVTGAFFGTAAQANGLATVGNKFTIEDVSINLGTVALPNVVGFDAELARCERYCELSNSNSLHVIVPFVQIAPSPLVKRIYIGYKVIKNAAASITITDGTAGTVALSDSRGFRFSITSPVDTEQRMGTWIATARL